MAGGDGAAHPAAGERIVGDQAARTVGFLDGSQLHHRLPGAAGPCSVDLNEISGSHSLQWACLHGKWEQGSGHQGTLVRRLIWKRAIQFHQEVGIRENM